MRERSDSTSVSPSLATEKVEKGKGEIVSVYVDYDHPLLQLKRALPWEAIQEPVLSLSKGSWSEGGGPPGKMWMAKPASPGMFRCMCLWWS